MSSSIVRCVGLDVHKRVVEACLLDAAGKILQRERFALGRIETIGQIPDQVPDAAQHVVHHRPCEAEEHDQPDWRGQQRTYKIEPSVVRCGRNEPGCQEDAAEIVG